MLNELESLSGNIGRLIQISERHKQAHQALQEQLEQLRADYANVQAELVQVREERDALQSERDSLSAKIDDDTTIFSVGNPIPVDQVIVMRAFAKARGTAQWTRVDSRCGVRDGHVVGVSLTPNMKPRENEW